MNDVFALWKGYCYRVVMRLRRGRRFQVGRQLRLYGRLSIRGPGTVIIGDRVAIWGRVNAWTYAPSAQILVEDDVILSGSRLAAAQQIRVRRNALVAEASIRDTDFHSTRADRRSPEAPVRVEAVDIGENVTIAAGAVLLPGTTIGENAIVGEAAVCWRSVAANTLVVGNPATVAKPIPSREAGASSSAHSALRELSGTHSSR
jgi:acetyltransferase-like isoleucine patch superfamily enzyme